jgi:hypothetical protein
VVAGERRLRSTLRLAKEGSAFFEAVTELMAEEVKGADGIAETAGDLAGGCFLENNYLFDSTGRHMQVMPKKHFIIKFDAMARMSRSSSSMLVELVGTYRGKRIGTQRGT